MGDANVFEADTAVRDEPIPREARPTDAIDALDRLPRADGTRPSTSSFEVVTSVNELPLPREALRTNAILAIADVQPSEAGNDASSHADKIAERRGLPPIARPHVARPGVSRGWLYAAACVSITSAIVAATAVAWARREAQRDSETPARPMQRIVASAPIAEPVPVASPLAIVEPRSCTLRISANVRGASVRVDGVEHGIAPAQVPIECGRETSIELRHSRYQGFERKLSVDGGGIEINATLEREQTELSVSSQPLGATVSYNGRALGKTPLVTKVNRYERATLRFRAPGMVSRSRNVTLDEPAETVRIELRARRR
jgi:hypothetical protein